MSLSVIYSSARSCRLPFRALVVTACSLHERAGDVALQAPGRELSQCSVRSGPSGWDLSCQFSCLSWRLSEVLARSRRVSAAKWKWTSESSVQGAVCVLPALWPAVVYLLMHLCSCAQTLTLEWVKWMKNVTRWVQALEQTVLFSNLWILLYLRCVVEKQELLIWSFSLENIYYEKCWLDKFVPSECSMLTTINIRINVAIIIFILLLIIIIIINKIYF